MAALRDHAGHAPADGLRMMAPCAHASWLPTRHAGQTTASMVSRLSHEGARHWMTGTSSPCLSVFKPVGLSGTNVGPAPGDSWDEASLWWRHEQLHRRALADYGHARQLLESDRAALEARALDGAGDVWEEHRQKAQEWAQRLPPFSGASPYARWWKKQSALDRLPA